MPTFGVQVGEEIIELRTAVDRAQLKLTANRFINVIEKLAVLKKR